MHKACQRRRHSRLYPSMPSRTHACGLRLRVLGPGIAQPRLDASGFQFMSSRGVPYIPRQMEGVSEVTFVVNRSRANRQCSAYRSDTFRTRRVAELAVGRA